MTDLYIENFFHRSSSSVATIPDTTEVVAASEESISKTHFFFRILKEETHKQLQDASPFPLLLEKLEETIFSPNHDLTFALLDEFEELLDLKYLPTLQ